MLGGYSAQEHPWWLGAGGLFAWSPVSDTGHEWVCDGSNITTYYTGFTDTYQDFFGNIYTDTYYTNTITYRTLHMNWGWQGYNNGWFDCDINYTASPASLDFTFFQTVIYDIQP